MLEELSGVRKIINKKLWVVSELYFPEETSTAYIMTKITDHLAKNKKVGVICGPAYEFSNQQKVDPSVKKDYEIIRLKTLGLNKDKLFQRILRLILLSIQLSYKLLVTAKKGEEVLIVTNPAPLVLLVVFVCRIKKMKCYAVVHDVFPENLAAAKLIRLNSFTYKILQYFFDGAYSKMNKLCVLGRDMKKVFEQKLSRFKHKPSIHIVENWSEVEQIYPEDRAANSLLSKHALQDKIVFQFSGNLGRVQGLMELCEVIRQVTNPLVHFMFIGEGAIKNEMKTFTHQNKLQNILFINTLPRSMQNHFLNACDVGIVSLQQGMSGLGVPSKSYNILSAGKPILFIGPKNSEIAQMVDENQVGWCFENDDNNAILAFFNHFSVNDILSMREKGQKARALALSTYSENIIMNKYIEIIGNG